MEHIQIAYDLFVIMIGLAALSIMILYLRVQGVDVVAGCGGQGIVTGPA